MRSINIAAARRMSDDNMQADLFLSHSARPNMLILTIN